VEEGQAPVEQPQVSQDAPDPMKGFLQVAREEFGETRHRDESGKFTKANPETPTEEAKPEAAPQQEESKEPQADEDQPEITPETRRFKLKYKGEELEKEEPEVIELAQKGFDYTQKAQALAKEREELSVKVKSEVEARAKAYEDQLETYKQAVLKLADQEAMTADLDKLSEQDPALAQKLFFKRQKIIASLQAIGQEQQRVATQRQEEAKKAFQKQIESANEVLSTEIKGWNNDLYSQILETATKEYGFKAEEANAIVDPRAIKVLHDAMQYRAAKAKPIVDKRQPQQAPKVVKPGAGEKTDAKADKYAEDRARLRKSGRKEDALPIFARLLQEDGSLK
jgi:hypothetical protein